MPTAAEWSQRSAELADDVLFPAAAAADRSGQLPSAILDLLAAEGFYGIAASAHEDEPAAGIHLVGEVVSAFAGGCLSVAFIWIQHHGAVLGVSQSRHPAVRERWLTPLVTGEVRAGIALAGLRPGPDQVRLRETAEGSLVSGRVPWVTGWDHIDVVYLAAVGPDDVVHFLLIDAVASPTLAISRPVLMAVQASSTVEVTFADHRVQAARLVTTVPLADWTAANASGSALNGFLALGVAQRAARLMDTDAFDLDLARCRDDLLRADASGTPSARADVSLLAHRAAAALAVHTGSAAAYAGSHAERLLREAGFLLVFGSRPVIRTELLHRLRTPG